MLFLNIFQKFQLKGATLKIGKELGLKIRIDIRSVFS